MCNDLRNAAPDHVAHPQRREPHAGDGDDEADDRQAFVPRGVGEPEMRFVGTGAVEYLPDHPQDVDRRDDDRRAGDDRHHTVERVVVHERAVEDRHLGDEPAQAGQAQVRQARDDVAHRQEGHHLHQPAQFAHVARMRAAVDHADQREEERRHQAVAQHLQDSARTRRGIHHQDGEQHQSAVRH